MEPALVQAILTSKKLQVIDTVSSYLHCLHCTPQYREYCFLDGYNFELQRLIDENKSLRTRTIYVARSRAYMLPDNYAKQAPG